MSDHVRVTVLGEPMEGLACHPGVMALHVDLSFLFSFLSPSLPPFLTKVSGLEETQ